MKILLAWRAQFMNCNGGMEHVCSDMANELNRRKHKVGLLYCAEKDGQPYFPIDPNIQLMNMVSNHQNYMPLWARGFRELLRIYDKKKMFQWASQRKNRFLIDRVQRLLKEYDPDVIISFDLTTTMLLRESIEKTELPPVVTMIHFPIQKALRYHSQKEKEAIIGSTVVQVLTQEAASHLKKLCPEAHICCIPNAVPQYEETAKVDQDTAVYKIIYIARLDKQKQQDLLLNAFAGIADHFPNWNLEFWGADIHSSYAKWLYDKIQSLHLENKVFLRGTTKDVHSAYLQANILAFPSASEGFPLAMTEGMSAGLPVVAFRSCSGINELVEDGQTGFLVEDGADAFAEKLKVLMNNREKRAAMGRAAHEAMKVYTPGKIWDQWDILLGKIIR